MRLIDSRGMGDSPSALSTAALFAGIAGIELGLKHSGHQTALFCEWLPAAQRVLEKQFPDIPVVGDVAELEQLPAVDLVTAGFPCQDLSQAGRTAGIRGEQSGLVEHVFRLFDQAAKAPSWLMLENVPFMLSLDKGEAMRWLTNELEDRGFLWAYRVVDSRAFGLPQRRLRVLLLASQTNDPRPLMFNQDEGERDPVGPSSLACGFYWTEGNRGLGWAIDAIPTLKGGSSLGIPSAPAIWQNGTGRIVTPDIRDAERLQGFDADWTAAADNGESGGTRSERWKLVGNAVSVPVAAWIGERLLCSEPYDQPEGEVLGRKDRWPKAAWGKKGERRAVDVTTWPVAYPRPHLHEFLEYDPQPLSVRATAGFLKRAKASSLRIPDELICEAEAHLDAMTVPAAA